MQIIWLLATCHYAGIRSVCAQSSSMTVDDAIETIPQREFYQWTSLVTIEFSADSNLIQIEPYAFYGCTGLQVVTFPPSLETIDQYAFYGCSSLPAIHFPASLSQINIHAFNACKNLADITAAEDIRVASIGTYVFRGAAITTFAIWKNLITISGAFTACSHLCEFTNPFNNPNFNVINGILFQGTELVVMPMATTGEFTCPANVTSIIAHSCWGIGVESFSFEPNSKLTSFGSTCFYTAKFTSFEFPDCEFISSGIPGQMFFGCPNLKTITIPHGIQSIVTFGFRDCGLEYIDVVPNHPRYESVDGVLFSKDLTQIVVCPCEFIADTYVIPKTVTSIATTAFRVNRISSIVFEPGSKLELLGDSAFFDLRQSTFSFDLDCPLTSISKNCFESSTMLESIVLPRNLQSIDGSAFSNTGLKEFIIPGNASHLVSDNGVLYSKDGTILYRFPPAKVGGDYEVPFYVEIVGVSAFATCSAIQTLTFAHGSKLQTVKQSAFASSKITAVVFGDDSDDVTFERGCFTSSSVKFVTLPGRMEIIKQDLFKDCFDLIGITLPETAATIESGAFTNCEALVKLAIPMFCQIRKIPAGAFTNTRSLTELELPYLVESVAANSLPANLQKLTLWCPLTTSVINAIQPIPTLQDIYILCERSLDTSDFVAKNINVHFLCYSRKVRRRRVGKLTVVVFFIAYD